MCWTRLTTEGRGFCPSQRSWAVWAAGKAIQYLEAGLNAVNGMYETRRWLVIRFWSVIYTLVFVLALLTG